MSVKSVAEMLREQGEDVPEREPEPEFLLGRPPVVCPKCRFSPAGRLPGIPCFGGTTSEPCDGTLILESVFTRERLAQKLQAERDRRQVKQILEAEERGTRPAVRATGLTLTQLATKEFPERPVVLLRDGMPFLKSKGTVQIYAARGVGKTWFAETLALIIGGGAKTLGLSAPEPLSVLYIDGEMASEDIQERFEELRTKLKVPPTDLITVVGYDWHLDDPLPRLDTLEGQEAVEHLVAAHDVIVLDNRSCLFDPLGEKDPEAWQPAQDWILSLRRRGKTVIIIHHANKQGGSRGHSKAEDFLDLCIELARPDGYDPSQLARFQVNITKARGIRDARAATPFIAALTPTGWVIEEVLKENEQETLAALKTYLTKCESENTAKPKSQNEAFKDCGGNRNTFGKMWKYLAERQELLQANGVYRLVLPSTPPSNPAVQEQLAGIEEQG